MHFHEVRVNIKGKDSRIKALSADIDVLSSLVDAPEGNRVYQSYPRSIALLILVQYVDNMLIRYVVSARAAVSSSMSSMPLSEMTGASISTSLELLVARRALHLRYQC